MLPDTDTDGRVPSHDGQRLNTLKHHCSSTNNAAITDVCPNNGAVSDPAVPADRDGFECPTLQAYGYVAPSKGVLSLASQDHHATAHEDIVADCRVPNVAVRTDVHVVSDADLARCEHRTE
jgi:hypothetical protein